MRASKFLDAGGVEIKETVPASRKLGRSEAAELARAATRMIVCKGKSVRSFELAGEPDAGAVDAMLGPTGNLRAPTLRVGKALFVGFNEDEYKKGGLGGDSR